MEALSDTANNVSAEKLSGVAETLLIPLAARLVAARQNPDLGFVDPAAARVGAALAFDPARFASDRGSMRGSIVRAMWFDRVARDFVEAHADGLIVSIGSGLDTRANRIAPPTGVEWVDIDFGEVVALREAVVPFLPNVRNLACDGTDVAAWAELAGWESVRPILVIAEGVSMYLEPVRGEAWLRALADQARQRESVMTLALDLASPFMARHGRRNPSVEKTDASFQWGVGEPRDLSRVVDGLTLVETYDVARLSGALSRLVGDVHRLLTRRPLYSCALFTLPRR